MAVVLSYRHALTPVFRYLSQVFAVGLMLALLLPERKLASTQLQPETGAEPEMATADRRPVVSEDIDGKYPLFIQVLKVLPVSMAALAVLAARGPPTHK